MAAELKRIRTDLDVPGESVAADLGWSQSKVSRIETGRIAVSVADLATLLQYYGVESDIKSELLAATATDVGLEGAWVVRAGGRSRRQSQVAAIETTLIGFTQYQALLIPGQMQSKAYALHHLQSIGSPNAESLAAKRIGRQMILESEHAPHYACILDARAFIACPDEILSGLIAHISARAALPNVSVRVLPLGSDSGRAYVPFIVYDFKSKDSPKTVLIEAPGADLYLASSSDVAIYEQIFLQLAANSLDESRSIDYLKGLPASVRKIRAGR